MTDPTPAPSQDAPVLDATEARQGRRGKHALWILVISLALVVVALMGTWASHSSKLADAEPNKAANAAAFDAPAAAPLPSDINQPAAQAEPAAAPSGQ